MAGSVSPATGRAYGVARVCTAWGVPRSSFYLARHAAEHPAPAGPTGRRGPKPALPDAALLAAIRADLARSPHRARPRPTAEHDRTIVTAAPNVMWATDGTQVATVRDGKVWLFATVEHWNAEALGWHVAKRGTRQEARPGPWAWPCASSSAISAGTPPAAYSFATITVRGPHAACGVGWGSCFMAEDFQTQIRARGA